MLTAISALASSVGGGKNVGKINVFLIDAPFIIPVGVASLPLSPLIAKNNTERIGASANVANVRKSEIVK